MRQRKDEPLSKTIAVSITQNDYGRLRVMSENNHIPTAQYIREALIEKLNRDEKSSN